MNPIVPRRKRFHVLLVCTTIALLCSASSSFAGETIYPSGRADTILISKSQSSKKHKIRLYPNADNRVIFFTASGEQGRVYQLFVFDMDGKLQKQLQVRNKETTVLTNIVKGDYLFEVFSDDERIENGRMVIK